MKTILAIISAFIFIGCSSSNVGSEDDLPKPPDEEIDYSLFNQQWSVNEDQEFYAQNGVSVNASVNAQDVFNRFNGHGVKVAVIDDGFDTNHPEIKDKIIKTISVNEYGYQNEDVSHLSADDYHGTAVAGIIASKNNEIGVVGVASDVELILIQMPEYLDDALTIELFALAVEAGADVINCSWGTDNVSEAVVAYIDEISTNERNAKGVIIVFASGNSDSNMRNDESAIDSVVGVGATDKTNLRTNYSNYGKDLDVMAPGGFELGITTLDPLGSDGISENGYNLYNQTHNGMEVSFIGTSASAPIITGAIALALQKDASLTRVEIQELLKESTTTIGENTPYIDDMILSKTPTPVISGIYGQAGYSETYVSLTSYETDATYGPYEAQSSGHNGENEEWESHVSDSLPDDRYYIEVISVIENQTIVWATDTNFTIDSHQSTQTDKSKRRSDFYGYGKIDLHKFIENI